MKGKICLSMLFVIAGCGDTIKPEFTMPDASCHEVHDSNDASEVSADATQTSADTQSVDASQDTTEAKD